MPIGCTVAASRIFLAHVDSLPRNERGLKKWRPKSTPRTPPRALPETQIAQPTQTTYIRSTHRAAIRSVRFNAESTDVWQAVPLRRENANSHRLPVQWSYLLST